MKIGYDVYLSDRVNELLEEGTIKEVFTLLEDDLKGSWLSTAPEDTATREGIYRQLHSLNLLRIKMETLVTNIKFPSLGDI